MNKGGKNETSADKSRTSASKETVAKNKKTVEKERVKAPKKSLKQRLCEDKVSIAVLSAIIAADISLFFIIDSTNFMYNHPFCKKKQVPKSTCYFSLFFSSLNCCNTALSCSGTGSPMSATFSKMEIPSLDK